jgi:hypothetical protein
MPQPEHQISVIHTTPESARVRKCYRLCQAVLKNAAYYKGGASLSAGVRPKSQFAIGASNNFLDMTYLDWSKLFWDKQGVHRWDKILPSSASFKQRLLAALRMDDKQFDAFAKSVAHYRDKELAHADVYDEIDIPELAVIIESTLMLYESLRSECGYEPSPPAPYDLRATFEMEVDHGRSNFIALSRPE